MGINEFLYGGSMWLGGCAGLKRLIIVLLCMGFSHFTMAEHPFTTDNKMQIIGRDLLEGAFNRANNLPAVVDDVQALRKANLLRKIAHKATGVSLTLGKKNPLTALAVSLGVGAVADELIDKGFEKFTGAEQDEHGFYVEVTDPNTYQKRKVYLEEEPNRYNPAYVYKTEKVEVSLWRSEYGECDNEDLDQAAKCSMNVDLQNIIEDIKRDSPFGITIQSSSITTYKKVDLSEISKRLDVSYSVTYCLIVDSSNCDVEEDTSTITLTAEKAMVDKYSKVPLQDAGLIKSLSETNKPLVTGDSNLVNLFQNLLTLGSNDFTDEERQVIYLMNPSDLYKSYSDPSLSYDNLKSYTYSDDMLDEVKDKKGDSPIVIGGSNGSGNNGNQGNNNNDNEDYGEPDYPDLEPPTALQILEPFKKFFPTLQNFKLTAQSATCPTWSFELWNKTFTIDSHCPLLEQQRSLIQLIFSILWAFIALRQLLTA